MRQRVKRVVQIAVWFGLGLVGTLARRSAGGHHPLRAGDPHVRRILVIRVDLIGDVVLSLPAVHGLRQAYPRASIDMLVRPSTADLVRGHPDVRQVLEYDASIWRSPLGIAAPRTWRLARNTLRTLRTQRYDLCVSIAGDWASVLAWASGARRRVGYAAEAYAGLLTDAVPGGRYGVRQHEIEYGWRLAQAAGAQGTAPAPPLLHIRPEAAVAATALLHTDGDRLASGPLIALHPGARNGLSKRWPEASWVALARALHGEVGARVILVGAAGDRAVAHAIAHASGNVLQDLTGHTSLGELAAILAQCALLISGDSGPLHIACALGTPVVGLYGPTDPLISGPVGPHALVVRQPMWCAPCYDARATADCRFSNPVCMKTLSTAAVLAAAKRQLTSAPPTAPRLEREVHAGPGPASSRSLAD
jgi:lipopolysaccharide heptosyltransferase II